MSNGGFGVTRQIAGLSAVGPAAVSPLQFELIGHYAKSRCGTDIQGTAVDSEGPI